VEPFQTVVEAEGIAVGAVLHSEELGRVVGQGQGTANGLIGVEFGLRHRDHHVVAIVSAEKEDADEGFVVGRGRLRQGVHGAEGAEAK
jgi:hypothetical protein